MIAVPAMAEACAVAALHVDSPAGDAPLEGADWRRLPPSAYRDFVAALCAGLAARPHAARLHLEIRHQALFASPPPPAGPLLLDSPWIAVAAGAPPRASVLWSERQVLLDRALADGLRPLPARPLPALDSRRFAADAEAYIAAVLDRPKREPPATIPIDLLWLFRHSVQSTRGPFGGFALAALGRTLAAAAPGQAALTLALLDRALAPGAAPERFDSVLELPPGLVPNP